MSRPVFVFNWKTSDGSRLQIKKNWSGSLTWESLTHNSIIAASHEKDPITRRHPLPCQCWWGLVWIPTFVLCEVWSFEWLLTRALTLVSSDLYCKILLALWLLPQGCWVICHCFPINRVECLASQCHFLSSLIEGVSDTFFLPFCLSAMDQTQSLAQNAYYEATPQLWLANKNCTYSRT
jgi:hypothetical protein